MQGHEAKKQRYLAVGLLVATTILFFAIGVGVWWYMQRVANQVPLPPQIDKSETRDVTDVTWVPPTLPPDYPPTEEYTQNIKATVYKNDATGCWLLSRVALMGENAEATALKGVDEVGFTTNSVTKSETLTLGDTDDIHEYPFASLIIEQAVSAPEVPVTAQTTWLYYKQFGAHVAGLSVTCAAGSDQAAKLQQLAEFAKQFKVKTERQPQ